ncbi:MAG: GNAT family N-acetyltransferase [Burkholderiales bacterium]|nr:GNAT family N-acetyltransferase [Phycisphaerae bacterium]
MAMRILTAEDAALYRAIRMAALEERPPAFGSLPEAEPDLHEMATRLSATRDRCFLGAIHDEQLVGVIRISHYDATNEKHRAYLAGLFVSPPLRRCGYGRALVRAALDRATSDPAIRRVNLTVVTEQRAAISLYESFGFAIYGTEREAFSCDGRLYDEHLMTLDLTPAQNRRERPVA